ncbi:hypothetical protein FO519_003770 [Halicephalobus sp. NKZ332]|nr:hypothetical protein FO519_003770 [Halicephalobus sp. NKZ332]
MQSPIKLLVPLIFFFILYSLADYQGDPYGILGISRGANQKEIKKAYKSLVLEWHPDRNDDPKANEKFVQIQKAYEVLSDPKRKEKYDRYGSFDETPQQHYQNNGFHDFFDFGFGNFGGQPSFFENHRITYRMYMNSILEKSHTQPFIIFGYSSYCHACFRLESIWKEAVADLESLGYGIGTVNAMTDGILLEKLRVTTLPSLVVLIEGRVVHYRKSFHGINAKTIRLFARDTIPTTFLQKITTHSSLRRFLDQWESTNKVSILMLGAKEEPRLRYYLTAMKYAHFARFAYVSLSSHSSEVSSMKEVLGIRCSSCENILIFKEKPETGDAARMAVTTTQFGTEEIQRFLEKEKFLKLPRLSSMQYLDDLCPVSSRSLRHFCVILPVTDSSSDVPYIEALRRFISLHPINEKSHIHLVYIYRNKQPTFMEQFPETMTNLTDEKKGFLVFWRNEYVKAKYAWWGSIWTADKKVEHKSFELLKEKLHLLERGNMRLEELSKIVNLVDEYEPSWFTKICRRAVRMMETLWFYITKEEALPILSILGTFAVIMIVGYKQVPPSQQEWHPEDPKTVPKRNESMKSTASIKHARMWKEMQPLIHELRGETYFGLIRLLKPGCRSIIILVDKESKDVLLPQFSRYIWPLRNNKTFSFGYLMVDKNLTWFRTILEQILPTAKDSETGSFDTSSASSLNPALRRLRDINPKHTLGTVLILCGYKLYFSMYHPMYKIPRAAEDEDLGSSDSDVDSKQLKKKILKQELNIENVLNGFPNFLDRLLEGSVPRFYLPEWPDNLK